MLLILGLGFENKINDWPLYLQLTEHDPNNRIVVAGCRFVVAVINKTNN